MVFSKESANILGTEEDIHFLQSIKPPTSMNAQVPPVNLFCLSKTRNNFAKYPALLQPITGSGQSFSIGFLAGSKCPSKHCDWESYLNRLKFKLIDISADFVYLSASKTPLEIDKITTTAHLTYSLMSEILSEDNLGLKNWKNKPMTHGQLAEKVEDVLEKEDYKSLYKMGHLELCYGSIFHSGSDTELFSPRSDEKAVRQGPVTCSLGLSYEHYCANVIRTVLVDPTEQQRRHLSHLSEIYRAVLAELRDGALLSSVYAAAKAKVRQIDGRLESHLTEDCGFSAGIEFCKNNLRICPESTSSARLGMTFNLVLGLTNLRDPSAAASGQSEAYSLFIGDTVLVNGPHSPATCLGKPGFFEDFFVFSNDAYTESSPSKQYCSFEDDDNDDDDVNVCSEQEKLINTLDELLEMTNKPKNYLKKIMKKLLRKTLHDAVLKFIKKSFSLKKLIEIARQKILENENLEALEKLEQSCKVFDLSSENAFTTLKSEKRWQKFSSFKGGHRALFNCFFEFWFWGGYDVHKECT